MRARSPLVMFLLAFVLAATPLLSAHGAELAASAAAENPFFGQDGHDGHAHHGAPDVSGHAAEDVQACGDHQGQSCGGKCCGCSCANCFSAALPRLNTQPATVSVAHARAGSTHTSFVSRLPDRPPQ